MLKKKSSKRHSQRQPSESVSPKLADCSSLLSWTQMMMSCDWKKSLGPNMQRRKGKKLLLRTNGRMVKRHPMASMAGMFMVSELRLIHLGHIRLSHHWSRISEIMSSVGYDITRFGVFCFGRSYLKCESVTMSEKVCVVFRFLCFSDGGRYSLL